jgi:hypothetical protein
LGARSKLNVATVYGCLLVAAIAGVAMESWLVFWLVAIVLIAGEWYTGAIRGGSGRSDRPRR